MTTNPSDDLEKSILQQLEDANNRNDIILNVSELEGMDWKEAERLVDSVQAKHAHDITLIQSPLLVSLALVTFLAGASLLAYVIYNAITIFESLYWARSQMPNEGPFGWKVAHDFLIVMMTVSEEYFALLVLGVAMVAGSLRGMQDVWEAVFAKLGMFSK